jgi:RNA polymerase sigma-70 factor (ECF subfamily)
LLRRLAAICFALTTEGEHPREAASDISHSSATSASFEAFFRQHEQQIFSYLWRMTGDEQAAYDLSQEAFLRAWRHFDRLQGYELPAGWLFRVATNLALKHVRHHHVVAGLVVTSLQASASAAEPSAPDSTASVAEDDFVREILLDLLLRPRAVLVLHDVHGFTAAEIAGMLAMTHAAVKMMLCRAREQFRARYLHLEAHP